MALVRVTATFSIECPESTDVRKVENMIGYTGSASGRNAAFSRWVCDKIVEILEWDVKTRAKLSANITGIRGTT